MLKCHRCGQSAPSDLRSNAAEGWNGKWEKGRLAFVVCPDCQMLAESAEAEANAAELMVHQQDGGRFLPDPVVCMTGTLERPREILYGRDHLKRVLLGGRAERVSVVERLPTGTRCTATVGGVIVYGL